MSLPPITSQTAKKHAAAESCELESLPWLISNLRRQVREAVVAQEISEPAAAKKSLGRDSLKDEKN